MKRLVSIISIITLVTLLAGLVAVPVSAAELKTLETFRVAPGETLEGDLYFAGSSLSIEGTVNGDVYAVGQDLTISGTVKGGVTLAGARITLVNAKITNGARLAGSDLNVTGAIGRDLMAAGARLSSSAEIGGDVVLGVSQATISGPVAGSIKGGGSLLTLAGKVGKNIEVEADQLTISATATLGGNLDYTSANGAKIDSASTIKGLTNRHEPKQSGGWTDIGKSAQNMPVGFVMIFLIGLIFVLAMPKPTLALADAIRSRPVPGLGWGALILFATPVAALIVCFTVVGLPAGLITLALWGICLYLAQIPSALVLGRLILVRPGDARKSILIGQLAIGLAIIAVAGIIPVLGNIVMLASAIFGFGGLMLYCLQFRKPAAPVLRVTPDVPPAPPVQPS